jgi:hypothetical protein
MVKVSHNDSVPVMSHIESSIINRYESGVKIECSRDCSKKRNEICNNAHSTYHSKIKTLRYLLS